MNVYDFSEYDKFLIANNLTGSLKEKVGNFLVKNNQHLVTKVRRVKNSSAHSQSTQDTNSNYRNCVIVLNGNCGITEGQENFSEINDILKKLNIVVVLIRGISEDPSLFSEQKINYSNLIAVPDYSILKIRNVNALCVGGGISVNRVWKIKNDARNNTKTYYENELPFFNEEIKTEIEKFTANNNINIVISFESPTFALRSIPKLAISEWAQEDDTLLKDFMASKQVPLSLYNCLCQNFVIPRIWLCNEVENNMINTDVVNGILFTSYRKDNILDTSLYVTYDVRKNSKKVESDTLTFSDISSPFTMDKIKETLEDLIDNELNNNGGNDDGENDDGENDDVIDNIFDEHTAFGPLDFGTFPFDTLREVRAPENVADDYHRIVMGDRLGELRHGDFN